MNSRRDIDLRSSTFNMEEDSVEDVVEGIKKTADAFLEDVGEGTIFVNSHGAASIRCALLPVSDGDFYFWIGGQIEEEI